MVKHRNPLSRKAIMAYNTRFWAADL